MQVPRFSRTLESHIANGFSSGKAQYISLIRLVNIKNEEIDSSKVRRLRTCDVFSWKIDIFFEISRTSARNAIFAKSPPVISEFIEQLTA
jgi:hypothetical protein